MSAHAAFILSFNSATATITIDFCFPLDRKKCAERCSALCVYVTRVTAEHRDKRVCQSVNFTSNVHLFKMCLYANWAVSWKWMTHLKTHREHKHACVSDTEMVHDVRYLKPCVSSLCCTRQEVWVWDYRAKHFPGRAHNFTARNLCLLCSTACGSCPCHLKL